MPDWLTQADREEAIYMLKHRLTPIQMREVVCSDIEWLVAKTECSKGLLCVLFWIRSHSKKSGT
jgi:hypothetical protein